MFSSQEYDKLVSDLRQAVGQIDPEKFQALSSGLGLGALQRASAKTKVERSKSSEVASPQEAPVPSRPIQSDLQIGERFSPAHPQSAVGSSSDSSKKPAKADTGAKRSPTNRGDRPRVTLGAEVWDTPQVRYRTPSGVRAKTGLRFVGAILRGFGIHMIDLAVVLLSGAVAIATMFMIGRIDPALSLDGLERMALAVLRFEPWILVGMLYAFFFGYVALFYVAVGATFGQLILGKSKVSKKEVPNEQSSLTRI